MSSSKAPSVVTVPAALAVIHAALRSAATPQNEARTFAAFKDFADFQAAIGGMHVAAQVSPQVPAGLTVAEAFETIRVALVKAASASNETPTATAASRFAAMKHLLRGFGIEVA